MPATDTLFQAMEPLRLRYLDSPLPGWLRVAGETVLAMLPDSLRRQLGVRHRRLLMGVDAEGLSLRAQLDERTHLIGVLPVGQVDRIEVHYGPIDAVARGATQTWDLGVFSLRMIGKMLTGQVSMKNICGPLTIADYAK